jgi:hypothetical protein
MISIERTTLVGEFMALSDELVLLEKAWGPKQKELSELQSRIADVKNQRDATCIYYKAQGYGTSPELYALLKERY